MFTDNIWGNKERESNKMNGKTEINPNVKSTVINTSIASFAVVNPELTANTPAQIIKGTVGTYV